jgi:hypothetical protein
MESATMKFHSVLLRVLLLILTVSGAAWAQTTGSITGTVKDPTGAAIAGATVVVTSPERGITRQMASNSTGEYSETALPAGSYDIIVTAPGFRKYQAKGVKLDVAEKARVDVTLQVGATTTEVIVEGTAVAQVETQSSDLSGTVTGKEISQLELNGRNFTQLVTLVPGVNNQTGQDEGTVGVYGNVDFSINGGRPQYNNWEVDGGDNMDNGSNETLNVYPSIDAIGEFKVLTSNYGAQFGRNGSGTIEVETKSGTKGFHGGAYEYLRNDAFNSPAWFEGGVAPEYKKNDYGYNLGGPAYIPGVYNRGKDKTFFFWSEEWRKDIVPGQTFAAVPVPSVAERSGDFSDLCTGATLANPGACPVIGGVLTPNIATAASTSAAYAAAQPVAQGLFGMVPEPNGTGASTCVPGSANPCTFTSSPAQATNWREELIKVDHSFNDKIRAMFRFTHDSWQTTTATPLWTNAGTFPTIETAFKGPGVGLVFRLTATASPTLLNEFVFSYTTDHIILNDVGNWKRPSGWSNSFHDLFPGNGQGVLPGINLVDNPNATVYGGGFGEDSGNTPNGIYNSNPTYTFRDNVNKLIGRHNLQFGVYIAAAEKNEYVFELPAGSFPGYLTFTADASKNPNTSGNEVADMELGTIYSFGQENQLVKYYNRYKLVEPYFQDDWRITDRLTLNLGLRISGFGTYREIKHGAFNFDPAYYVQGQTSVNQDDTVNFLTKDGLPMSVTDLPNGIVQCGVTKGVPVGCATPKWFNAAPRIGFAWDPRGNGRWAIRGGYGIFYEHTNGNEASTESLEGSPPGAVTTQQLFISGYTNIGGAGGATPPVYPLNVTSIPTKTFWPNMQQWHLDLQHDIARNTVGTISYVGSKGTHLTRQSDRNQIYPTPLSQDPYKPGEAIGPNDCGTSFDAYGVPTNGMTPSGVPVPYATNAAGLPVGPAVNLGVANCGTLADPLRPYPGYGSITYMELESSSIYHALQASLRRNVGQLTLSAAYTYSHSIDDSSARYDGTLVNSYDFASNRASSNFDERHIFNFGYVWDIPFLRGRGLRNSLLGHWQFSGITGISTGTPFTVLNPTDSSGTAAGSNITTSRADIIGDPNTGFSSTPINGWGPRMYNPAAYATPRGLTFGDSGRNSLRYPRRVNFDMGLKKFFPIKENTNFEFRADAFNVFNHTEWSNSFQSTTWNDSGAFYINGVHLPRILQLALKFNF